MSYAVRGRPLAGRGSADAVLQLLNIHKDVDMPEQTSPLLYRVRHLEAPPAADAPWAVTVQSGEDDPEPRVLAYARAEHIAKRLCVALRQSDRLARDDNARAATAYAQEISTERSLSEDD